MSHTNLSKVNVYGPQLPSYPVSGQWITFPVKQYDKKRIEWSTEWCQHEADYYFTRCWWGSRKFEDGVVKGLDIIGETFIFIATEYVDDHFRGGPMKGHHVLDCYNENGWAVLRLDGKVHYGQDSSKNTRIRYIVYHPSIVPGSDRKIFQHRFVENMTYSVITTVCEVLTHAPDDHVKTGAHASKQLVKLFKNCVGDPLRNFVDLDGSVSSSGKEAARPDAITTLVKAEDAAVQQQDIAEAQVQPARIERLAQQLQQSQESLAPLLGLVQKLALDSDGKSISNEKPVSADDSKATTVRTMSHNDKEGNSDTNTVPNPPVKPKDSNLPFGDGANGGSRGRRVNFHRTAPDHTQLYDALDKFLTINERKQNDYSYRTEEEYVFNYNKDNKHSGANSHLAGGSGDKFANGMSSSSKASPKEIPNSSLPPIQSLNKQISASTDKRNTGYAIGEHIREVPRAKHGINIGSVDGRK